MRNPYFRAHYQYVPVVVQELDFQPLSRTGNHYIKMKIRIFIHNILPSYKPASFLVSTA